MSRKRRDGSRNRWEEGYGVHGHVTRRVTGSLTHGERVRGYGNEFDEEDGPSGDERRTPETQCGGEGSSAPS